MRYLKRLLYAAAFVGVSAVPASAQQLGGGGQTGGGLGGGQTGGGLGGGQGGGGATFGNTGQQGTPLLGLPTAPQITAPAATGGGAGGGGLDASNFLSGFYANPYYQGTYANQVAGAAPGGFGSPLSGTGTGTAATGGGVRANATGVRTGTAATAGRTGAAGATALGGRAGGVGGVGTTANYGVVVPMPVQLTYPAIAQFAAPPITGQQLQADLAGMIGRSNVVIPSAAGVQVLAAPGGVVVLRGNVRDIDEARLIESMARLTPGVFQINNELTFPAAANTGQPFGPATTFTPTLPTAPGQLAPLTQPVVPGQPIIPGQPIVPGQPIQPGQPITPGGGGIVPMPTGGQPIIPVPTGGRPAGPTLPAPTPIPPPAPAAATAPVQPTAWNLPVAPTR